ncbi:hypothetical protein KQI38_19970 [Tissierella carlieri]|uniref:Uncharacterized protein n=1 Tax=Tissierella carlieri TaxID=689904 RepID=A0ABT1S5H6_9FIRM|nr:hypothetical protein [Tissierella carlieri]MBU5314304.1 hypothetical protein [Tissierella carlieri]MCQ4921716.1 hypothetical protein [Tissierella carlieri]
MYENLPEEKKLELNDGSNKPKQGNRKEYYFVGNNSRISVGTVGNRSFGRGEEVSIEIIPFFDSFRTLTVLFLLQFKVFLRIYILLLFDKRKEGVLKLMENHKISYYGRSFNRNSGYSIIHKR